MSLIDRVRFLVVMVIVTVTGDGMSYAQPLAAGRDHSVARRTDRLVWTWGDNFYGQLGDGSVIDRPHPVQVVHGDGEPLAEIQAVAARGWHTLALNDDNRVWAWGRNDEGQLGDGTEIDRPHPVLVTREGGALLGGVLQLASGEKHSVALGGDGRVWAWGSGNDGQLGDGEARDTPFAVHVIDGFTDGDVSYLRNVAAVAAGRRHSLALHEEGTVWAWGSNNHGQIGAATDDPVFDFATQVVREDGQPVTNARAIAAGRFFSLALTTDGTLLAWGDNRFGQLADGTQDDSMRAREVPLTLDGTAALRLVAGGDHALTRASDDRAWTWGSNDFNQLARPQTDPYFETMPVLVIDADEAPVLGVTEIAAGRFFSLVHIGGGDRVLSWGDNGEGQLGQAGAGSSDQFVPSPVVFADGTPFTLTPIDVNQATGTITAPTGTVSGQIDVRAMVADPNGLARVWMTFVDDGLPLTLCGTGAPACPGTSGNVAADNVDPLDFGARFGPVDAALFVEDIDGDVVRVAEQSFLLQTDNQGGSFTLTVRKQGTGDGTLTTSPAGIDCGPGCTSDSAVFPANTEIAIMATSGADATFVGYAGERCFVTAPTCTIVLNRDLDVRATFAADDGLRLIRILPVPGSESVEVDVTILLVFDREIAFGPNAGDITFEDEFGQAVPFHAALSTSLTPTRLVLNPVSDLAENTGYVVKVPVGAVEDLAGNPLAEAIMLPFRTLTLGAPRLRMSATPRMIVEGGTSTFDVWFDRAQPFARTVTLSAAPAGLASLSATSLVIPAGEQIGSFTATGLPTNLDRNVIVTASEPVSGTASFNIEVGDITPVVGFPIESLGCTFVDDDSGNGIFEAGEDARFRFEMRNAGGSGVLSAEFCVSVVNAETFRLAPTSPCEFLGFLTPGEVDGDEFRMRAASRLLTGTYWLRINGTSAANDFVDYCPIEVVNTSLFNLRVERQQSSSVTIVEGETVSREYLAVKNGRGFDSNLPEVALSVNDATGVEVLRQRMFADIRGEGSATEEELQFTLPPLPMGTYTLRAVIDPPPGVIPESEETDNEAEPATLTVLRTNESPIIKPIPDPFTINVGERFEVMVKATDADGDPVSFRLLDGGPGGMFVLPDGMTIEQVPPTSARIVWTPSDGQGPSMPKIGLEADDGRDPVVESFTIDVTNFADLAVTKIAAAALAVPGLTIGYTIEVRNFGPGGVIGAGMFDPLEPRLVDATWTCEASDGSSCTTAGTGEVRDIQLDLLAGGMATYRVEARITSDAQGVIVNEACASIDTAVTDPVEENNCDTIGVTVAGIDFGDAPDTTSGGPWHYPTRQTEDGSRHGVVGLYLGASSDAEADGQPSLQAAGDDQNGDDEDGVALAPLLLGQETSWGVEASGPGFLNAWVDWNADGDWDDPGEHVLADRALVAGANAGLAIDVPADATSGTTFGRFRFASVPGLGTTGLAPDGEVEDYALTIGPPPVSAISLTAEVAPASVPEPGASVTVDLEIANTGTTPFDVDMLTADGQSLTGVGTCGLLPSLVLGERYSCSFETAVAGNAGQMVEIALLARGAGEAGPDEATATVSVDIDNVPPLVSVAVAASPATLPAPGGEVTLTVEVTNRSEVEELELGALSAAASGTVDGPGTCELPQMIAIDESYICTLSFLVDGQPGETVVIEVTAEAVDDDDSTVSVTGSTSVMLRERADLAVSKTDDERWYIQGDPLTYTIVVENRGPSDVVGATVTDVLPDGLSCLWSCEAALGTCLPGMNPGDVIDTIDLQVGGTATYTLACEVDDSVNGVIENTATVTPPAEVDDPDMTNNTATDPSRVVGLIFRDGFESGDCGSWSAVVPPGGC